jgi:hypothetical protein
MEDRIYAILPAAGRRRGPRGDARSARAAWPSACASTGRSASRASTPTRGSSGGRCRRPSSSSTSCARRAGRRRRAPQGHRDGHLPPALPRPGLPPEEVRSFYEDTVAPIVRYDDQYRTDLVGRSSPTSSRTAT